MSKEFIKTTVLALLIITSCVLAYKAWSFSPEFQSVDTTISRPPTASQGEPIDFENIMRAYQIVRVDSDGAKGTMDQKTLVDMREELDLSDIVSSNEPKNIKQLKMEQDDEDEEEFFIVDYFSEMPARTLFTLLDFDMEDQLKDYEFDRILIDLNGDYLVFNLVNEDRTEYVEYETDFKSSKMREILDNNKESFLDYSLVISNETTSNRMTAIYGPTSPGSKKVHQFIPSTMSIESMNQTLFSNDEITEKEDGDVTIYENDSGLATYSSNSYQYSFTNLKESSTNNRSPHRTIEKSFIFLNGHMGLSTRFILFDYDDDEGEVTYRQTLNDYVVFSDEVMSEINVTSGQDTILEYNRPMIQTNANIPVDRSVKLDDIETVRYNIASSSDYELSKVSKMVIAYHLDYDQDQSELNVVEYTPHWYILYDGEWEKFESEDDE